MDKSTPQARTGKIERKNRPFQKLKKEPRKNKNENVKLAVKASYLGSKIIDKMSKSFGDLKILDDLTILFLVTKSWGLSAITEQVKQPFKDSVGWITTR